jgi:malonyl CoA-acyl carrier protein transacylase
MTQFAFVFPGQSSQTVGMLSDMAAAYPVIEELSVKPLRRWVTICGRLLSRARRKN